MGAVKSKGRDLGLYLLYFLGGKNEDMIKKYASIIYNQKNNGYDVSYIKNVVDFKLLEQKCKEYKKSTCH